MIFKLVLFVASLWAATPGRDVFESRVLRLALEQAEKPSGYWDPAQRDCSGFVRFLYRQSLGPALGGWRRADGRSYDYASAEDLVANNFYFLARKLESADLRTGDVLVFYSENKKPADRYHMMVVLKSPYSNSGEALLAYHNGGAGRSGAVRKVSLSESIVNRNNEWSPVPENPRYRGAFRWNGWR